MSALVTTDEDFLARFEEDPVGAAITKRPPAPKFSRLGINQMGQLYEYGERPGIPKRVFTDPEDGLEFLGIHDIKVAERAGDRRKPYLDVTFGSLHPVHLYVLSLPVFNASPDCSSWPVRTLLGSLTLSCKLLDLRAMSGKLFTRRGTKPNAKGYVANFVDLYAYGSPTGEALARITADAIDSDRHSFEIAVNNLRRALDLEPQFQ
jgi:hypothetical protein